MKEFVEILKKEQAKQLEQLQNLANVVVDDEEEQGRFNEFVESELAKMISDNDDLAEKFIDIAVSVVAKELNIKPDPEYKRSEKEKALCEAAKALASIAKIFE